MAHTLQEVLDAIDALVGLEDIPGVPKVLDELGFVRGTLEDAQDDTPA